MKTIFSDKASIIIRAMLAQPKRKWTVRDFEKGFNIGRSRAAEVLSILRRKGYVGGIPSGRSAYNVLINKKALLDEWSQLYSYDFNKIYLYYSPDKDILPRLKKYVEKRGIVDKYVLTLHTGANLITNYVITDSVYCYLDAQNFKELALDLRQALNLKELKIGGNFFLMKPYYKKSVFIERIRIKGYYSVSYLQLYLDLWNFPQRGREHAKYLIKTLEEKGENLV